MYIGDKSSGENRFIVLAIVKPKLDHSIISNIGFDFIIDFKKGGRFSVRTVFLFPMYVHRVLHHFETDLGNSF